MSWIVSRRLRDGAIAFLVLMLTGSASAITYYVSGSGRDSANGLARHSAFRTLQHAADLTKPGDIVYAMNGTDTNLIPGGPVLRVTIPGTRDLI